MSVLLSRLVDLCRRVNAECCDYVLLGRNDDGDEDVKAQRHYRAAKVEETVYNLGDDVYIRVMISVCLHILYVFISSPRSWIIASSIFSDALYLLVDVCMPFAVVDLTVNHCADTVLLCTN